jgi:serine protease inhibitor
MHTFCVFYEVSGKIYDSLLYYYKDQNGGLTMFRRLIRTLAIVTLMLTIHSVSALGGNKTAFSSAMNKFAFDFFAEVNRKDFGQNIFTSPFSATMALAMVYNGADGTTKDAMEHALRWKSTDASQFNEYLLSLNNHLETIDPQVELNIANSIWINGSLRTKQSFIDTVSKYYQPEIGPLTVAKPINDWVKEKTKDKIQKIIDMVDKNDVMVLLNAIYFKGAWTSEFDPVNTLDREFELLDGSKITHPLMTQSGKFDYFETDKFQAIRLPYGNKKLSMHVFLPARELGLKDFQGSLNTEN